MKRRGSVFIKNTAAMTCASMLIKLIGLYLNIFLAHRLKAEGLGLYSLVMSVYMLAMGLSVSGMSVAVTRISSQEFAKGNDEAGKGTLNRCIYISLALSLAAAVVMSGSSGIIARCWIKDVRTVKCLCVLSMELPFVSISAMLRGWYTAKRKMLVPSIAQLAEQIVRVLACMIMVPMLARDAASGCFAVIICDLTAEVVGCMIIAVFCLISEKRKSCVPDNIGRRIIDHAVPVTASHYISTTLRTIESSLIPTALVMFGLTRSEALSQVGIIQSMAIPLLFFPSALLASASSLLVPEVVRYNASGNSNMVKSVAEKAIKLTMLCAFPVAGIFLVNAKEISMILYNEQGLIEILKVLSVFLPLMYSETVCTGLLRGFGEQKSLLYYASADGVMRLVLVMFLVPRFGVDGLLAVIIISNIFTPFMCLRRLKKITKVQNIAKSMATYFMCGALSTAVSLMCKTALSDISDKAVMIVGSLVFTVLYCLALFILASTQRQAGEARRVGLQIPRAIQCIFGRQENADGRGRHHVRHTR